MRRPERLAALLALLVAGSIARADETVPFAVHDLALTLPAGWTSAVERLDPADETTNFRTVLRARCRTERCATSLETCTFWVHDKLGKHRNGAELAQSIYAKTSDRYDFTRTALKHSGQGARVKVAADLATLGPNVWFLIETRAAGAYKSVLRADTMIEGRRVVAECRTCDSEDETDRFAAARALLGSLRIAPPAR